MSFMGGYSHSGFLRIKLFEELGNRASLIDRKKAIAYIAKAHLEVILRLFLLSLLSAFFCASALSEVQFAKTMAWSAYNLGTTGYNQSVALGKVLKSHYGVNLRVLPAKNDVSRLLPLVKDRVQFSANGIATYFAQEGLYQFAWKLGTFEGCIIMTSNGESNQSLGVAANLGITSFLICEASEFLMSEKPFWLRWFDLMTSSVNFPGYNAMWTGLVNNKVDAAYANTVWSAEGKLLLEVCLASCSS